MGIIFIIFVVGSGVSIIYNVVKEEDKKAELREERKREKEERLYARRQGDINTSNLLVQQIKGAVNLTDSQELEIVALEESMTERNLTELRLLLMSMQEEDR